MVRISQISSLLWLMTVNSVNAMMNFEQKTVTELVSILMAQNGDVEFQNVTAAPVFSECARYFTNGYSLGNLLNTTGHTNRNDVLTEVLDSSGNPIPIVPDKGVMLSSGMPSDFNNQTSDKKTTEFSKMSTDADLQNYVAHTVFDACWIKFKFKCTSEAYVPVVSFNYVFGSEEYYEYANTDFNDAFAFFLNGENIAKLPTTETSTDIVSINNVNYETNTQYFHGNDPGLNPDGNGPGYDPVGVTTIDWYSSVEADGFTSKLTARGYPKTGHLGVQDWNEIKLVVADVGDRLLDSWVLLESGTFSCVDITSAPSISSAPSSSPPTRRPTAKPTAKPSQNPTSKPTQQPSKSPTRKPTVKPTAKPTQMPTTSPTSKPSLSMMPSMDPSTSPSLSSSPSSSPSDHPTVSSMPSGIPSAQPSESTMPSATPSDSPSVSSKPSGQPSGSPTISSKPSHTPSDSPSLSSNPTVTASEKPSVSSSPSTVPSDSPSISPKPSAHPTANPSVSSSPSQAPSDTPSVSFKPTVTASEKPSVSSSPTDQPTGSPSISSSPSISPSSEPTVSSKPTIEGSYPPSVSSAPSNSPTDSPSKSPTVSPTKNPTTSPTSQPSISTAPSTKPSSGPSLSSSPSESPSASPSISTAPSEHPSSGPSISSSPSEAPSSSPSVSSKPTITASVSPSISAMPTGVPSDHPTVSLEPTGSPSKSPTKNPTKSPTANPSISSSPSQSPSDAPSVSSEPTVTASEKPSVSSSPSHAPSSSPSLSSSPSTSPSLYPSVSSGPTRVGSSEPSVSLAPSISPASIGPNTVFDDKNGNGLQDKGEPGIPDVGIILYKDGTQVASTTTDANGVYEFPDLSEGEYFVFIRKDPEYTFSPVVDGGNAVNQDGSTDPVTLKLGENADMWYVGMFIPVTLGNKVFDDLNGNAIQDAGEPGIPGVTVTLINTGSGEEVATQVTAADGSYLFTGLPPGDYAVQFEIPDTYVFTPPSNLNMDILNGPIVMPDYASDLNTETGITPSHSLESGDIDMTYDAAIYRPVSISGVTWHDVNANGILDEGEQGLEGSTVVLHNDDGEVVGMVITGTDGTYSFDGLPPDGYYSVIMPPSPEYLLSPMGKDSVFDPNSYMSSPVLLQSGDSGEGANAGMYMFASTNGLVWNDSPANGIQDADEGGFEGPVTINLYDSSGSIVKTTQTDANGSYTFTDVAPGDYEIEFVVEDGYHFTEQDVGNDDTKDSDVDSSGKARFTITSGEVKDIAAGVTLLASVGPNTVFEDKNGNGLQDEDEPGAPDVVIHLVDENGNRVSTTTSDANGEYEFQNIPSGNYYIQVDLEDGTSFSPVVDGGNQVSQVDDQPYGTSPVAELTVGTVEDTWNVGLIQPVSVGNKVWNDLNGDGIQDANEPGMEGITAILVDGSGTELDRMETDANGLYLFDNLEPGTYAVKFDIPDEYLFTPPAKTTIRITDPVDGSLIYEDVTSDVNVDTGVTDAVFLSSGEENLSFDAGIFIPVNISGTTWHDLNANGIEEEGEPGLPGSTVSLYDRDGDFVGVQITDSNGDFLFEDLPPGTYHTVLTPPSPEYLLSPKADDGDTDFNPDTFQTTPITLNSGESGEGSFDAGLYLPAKIGDRVWYDTELNGLQDADEGPFTDAIVTITLRDSLGYVVDTTNPAPGTGFYEFDGLRPGTYELTAEIDEIGYVFTMQNSGNDTALDSDVNPSTGTVTITVSSGEDNDSIDIGIMDDAPYYPDWQNDNQVCTNDGFDPEWLEIQRVNYLYKNKEACCKAHFWWRITQCMQNEEFKFYKNGEICDTKIFFEDWESNSPADWTDTTQFDTLDECCVNMFWYDINGCMERSPVMFKFEFCVDIKGLATPPDCQSADEWVNVLEDAINNGVNLDSDTEADDALTDANITSIGNVTLTKEKGSTVCGGSLEGQDFINDKTGQAIDIASAAETVTTVCGVITVEDAECTQEDCLREHYQNLTQILSGYVDDGSFKTFLNHRANTRFPPVPALQKVSAVDGSFATSNLLLPATITGDQIMKFYHGSDLTTCMEKTFFLETEVPYDSLHECCKVAFHWDVRSCCAKGGGCPELNIDESSVEYFPTWITGNLCDSKPSTSFESWEVNRFETPAECCDAFFPSQKAECCDPFPADLKAECLK